MRLCCNRERCTREPDTFQQKTKTGREKKNIEEGFHFTPDEQPELFVSRTFRFDSVPSFTFSTFETSGKRVVFIHRNHLEEEINPSLIILNISIIV